MKDIDKFKQLFNDIGLKWEEDLNDESDWENEISLHDKRIIIENKYDETVFFNFDESSGEFKEFSVID